MPFRIAARTILHLGAELISSDAIAFYELIKNAFDAGSPRVTVTVVIRIPSDILLDLRKRIGEAILATAERPDADGAESVEEQEEETLDLDAIKFEIKGKIDRGAPRATQLAKAVDEASDLPELSETLTEANYINIEDTGEGMSLTELSDVYLTIGTRSRLTQRAERGSAKTAQVGNRPILGEKGVGRLSAMRLGDGLMVRTTKQDEPRWNVLRIDWSLFSHASDALLEDIDIHPFHGRTKEDPAESGTQIRITGLTSDWSRSKLAEIAAEQFSRLTDPFTPSTRYPIIIKYNNDSITIPRFDRSILDHAHAVVTAIYTLDAASGPVFAGRVDYRHRGREKTFRVAGIDLISLASVSASVLRTLGPFQVEFYWYNRQILTAIEGIGDLSRVREIQARWAGGLMVFRDSFRVHPYADPADDWLGLDKRALASSGYKVNRRQIIGKVDIGSDNNPQLIDQTNREGLRDCPEKHALISILQHLLWQEFKPFLDAVDKEVQARLPATLHDIQERVAFHEQQVTQSVQDLVRRYPSAKENSAIVVTVNNSLQIIRDSIVEANALAESFEAGRTQLVHLAGLGLMVEFLAHELNRATSRTISTLTEAGHDDLPKDVSNLFHTLEAQLRTIQKRLRILDPLDTRGRQVKERFDLIEWVQEIAASHEPQFRRHGIRCSVHVRSDRPNVKLPVRAVKGMIVQILENLISNSVYWLKQQKRLDESFTPSLTITILPDAKEIRVMDNGPGIAEERREEIFQAFVTTKPPKEGRGLGLYVSREIAKYNDASLYLDESVKESGGRLRTFVLDLDLGVK